MSKQKETLRVFKNGEIVFQSNGGWLFPLFDLEEYLNSGEFFDRETLHLDDSVVGKAAAFLIARLGILSVNAGVMSRLGEEVLQSAKIEYQYEELVDRIMCQTEELLAPIEDSNKAYELLRERAGR